MWPLTDGPRQLVGPEADLFRGGVGMLIDQLVEQINQGVGAGESRDRDPADDVTWETDWQDEHFPRWFAMWEPDQRIWLLERVTTSVLTPRLPPPAAAIFEATLEAIYCEISDNIAMEVIAGEPIEAHSWRQALLNAYVARCPKDSVLETLHFETNTIDVHNDAALAGRVDEEDLLREGTRKLRKPKRREGEDWLAWWSTMTDRLLDATFGPRLYPQVERYRDGDPKKLTKFLESKGVNHRFLWRIPPLPSRGHTQAAIDRLQKVVFRDG
ncbi:MAG: hypothetical protein AAGD07_13110 [Planctomycetota bacterium]